MEAEFQLSAGPLIQEIDALSYKKTRENTTKRSEIYEVENTQETRPIVSEEKQSILRERFAGHAHLTPECILSISQKTGLDTEKIVEKFKAYKHSERLILSNFKGIATIYEENKHPSIQEMIDIGCSQGMQYKTVFRRFDELRFLHSEECPEGCICLKIKRFLTKHHEMEHKVTEENREILNEMFVKFKPKGSQQMLIGHLHLIMERTGLALEVIQKEFEKWRKSKRTTPTLLIPPQNVLNEFLLELNATPTPSNRIVELWAKKYGMSRGQIRIFIEKAKHNSDEPCSNFINKEYLKNEYPKFVAKLQPKIDVCDDENFWAESIKRSEILQGVVVAKPFEMTFREVIYLSERMGLNPLVVMEAYKMQPNKHPSIRDLIDISEHLHLKYVDVVLIFSAFRRLENDPCSYGDICQRVKTFFLNTSLLGDVPSNFSLEIMLRQFENLESNGKKLSLGYVHLLMEETKLKSLTIRKTYAGWLEMFGKTLIGLPVKYLLEGEVKENPNPTKEQIVSWAKKYDVPESRVKSFVAGERLKMHLS